MLILIEKDSATRIPKEVEPAEAEALAASFPVLVVNEDGSNTPFADWKAGQADGGSQDDDARKEATAKAFEKSGLSQSKWNKMPAAERNALIDAELVV
ncbi:C-type lectin-like domain-containing protein [Herminiimonas contaminans]|uniref:Uncharacterized protein n=1 Tax=Herminiimonas contaminans TaxID=1111140 RepID=A0ABS0ER39_9BURK|nr:hypothetical protein [Herminiimonas contaminans]MBF8177244.1 hypothetical protein [Herminiimonas contaminans]